MMNGPNKFFQAIVMRHLRGGYGIYRSFFMHTITPYIVLGSLMVLLQPPIAPTMIAIVVIALWGIAGTIASCVRTLTASGIPGLEKFSAFAILLLLIVVTYVIANDLSYFLAA